MPFYFKQNLKSIFVVKQYLPEEFLQSSVTTNNLHGVISERRSSVVQRNLYQADTREKLLGLDQLLLTTPVSIYQT